MNRYTNEELVAIATREIERYKRQINKIVRFCCELENQSYDNGMEDTIKPITDRILKIINRR